MGLMSSNTFMDGVISFVENIANAFSKKKNADKKLIDQNSKTLPCGGQAPADIVRKVRLM